MLSILGVPTDHIAQGDVRRARFDGLRRTFPVEGSGFERLALTFGYLL